MTKMIRVLSFGVAALLFLAGCSAAPANAGDAPQGEDTQVSYPQSVDVGDVPTAGSGNSGNVEQPAPGTRGTEASLIQRISQDLGMRLGVRTADVELVKIEEMTWADASLGCPAEGQTYAAGQVDGYRVTVRAAGKEYTYHTRGYDEFILCEDGKPVSYP